MYVKSAWSEDDHRFIELLKSHSVKEAESLMGWVKGYGYRKLDLIRRKRERAINIVNISNNWLDSAKNPRAAKLLRRAKDAE